LTFRQWWELWRDHYARRGRNAGQFVLCRYLDQGCYEVGNVRVDSVEANGHEKAIARSIRGETLKTNRHFNKGIGAASVEARPVWGRDPEKLMRNMQEALDIEDLFA
jgi:hypothetical protein